MLYRIRNYGTTALQAMVVVALLVAPMTATLQAADTLTIVHVNDTHSHLTPGGSRDSELVKERGGIARAASVIGTIQQTESNVLTLHAGDFFQGDLMFNAYFGVPELRMLVAMGFDAMTVGNHEFDLGPGPLSQAIDSGFVNGSFPMLCANVNLDDPSLEPLRNQIDPYTIKDVGGMKVGIFGLTTPLTNETSMPAPAQIEESFPQRAGEMVQSLRSEGCDVVILLSHLGTDFDKIVATNVPGIDVIIGGHSHELFEQAVPVPTPTGDTTWITQAGAFYENVGRTSLIVDGGTVQFGGFQTIALDSSVPEAPQIKAIVDGLIEDIENRFGPMYSQQVAQCSETHEEKATDLLEIGPKDTPIGNLVTDAFRAETGTDVALQPGGFLAVPLYEGPITSSDLFRVVSYGFNTVNGLGFRIVTFDMQGAALMAGLVFGLGNIEADDEFLLQVSGMMYEYDPEAPSGERVVSATIGGEQIDPTATYSVTTNEFLPVFLEQLGIPFSNVQPVGDTTEFHLLLNHVIEQGLLEPIRDGRIEATHSSSVREPGRRAGESVGATRASPNPFSSETVITFSIHRPDRVKVEVVSTRGEQVAILLDERMPPGNHSVVLQEQDLPDGAYFCRVRTGKESSSLPLKVVR